MAIKLCVDIGSSNTTMYRYGSGIVLSEPSVAAVDAVSGEIKAVGADAKRLIGKTAGNIKIIFPIFEGDIVNEDLAAQMLKHFLKKIDTPKTSYAIFSLPCGLDAQSLAKYGALAAKCAIKKVDFVIEPILAAIGQNIALNEFSPCFSIDMGGGLTNMAVFSLSGIIAGISMNIGGTNIDAHIIDHIAEVHRLKIGLLSAERLKISTASLNESDNTSMPVNGRDTSTGKGRTAVVSAQSIFEPVSIYIDKIIEYANDLLSKLPAEVLSDIRHSGLFLSGGLSRLTGAQTYFNKQMSMAVHIADSPELAAAAGGGILLNNAPLTDAVKLKFIK